MITKEALQFLDDLLANNNTEWMHANKKRYENYKKDYHNYIASILAEIKPLDRFIGACNFLMMLVKNRNKIIKK